MKYIITIVVILVAAIAVFYSFTRRTPSSEVLETETPTPNPDVLFEDVTELKGSGQGAEAGNQLSVLYTGRLANGDVFDSTSSRNDEPLVFTLGVGQVIPGWDQGLLGMKEGERRSLSIPSELAYGSSGIPGSSIGPNADLFFEVELLSISQ
jgi:peptidylprolyl isomerase